MGFFNNGSRQVAEMVSAVRLMQDQHSAGAIDYKIPLGSLQGAERELADAVNRLVQSHIDVKMQVVDLIREYGKGDFSRRMERLPGLKGQITQVMDEVHDNFAANDKMVVATRIRHALDNVTTNVMIADNDGFIRYMNHSVSAMLVNAEADVRKALPNFDAKRLLGVNFDVFHKNPAHQRNLLGQLRGVHRAFIEVGGRHFSLTASPIFDEAGERQGSVVEWKDRTDEVAVEKELAGVVNAASAGDFSSRLDPNGKEGFFKQLCDGINTLVGTCDTGLNEVLRVLAALAGGRLDERITNDYSGT